MCLGGAARQRSVVLAGVQVVFGTGTVRAGGCSDSKQHPEQTPERRGSLGKGEVRRREVPR